MTINRKRQTISKEVESFDTEGQTLGAIRDRVAQSIKLYGEDAKVEMLTYDYDDGEYPYIFVKVPETDEQMNARIREEEKWETQRQERDKREFERLSKQFSK